MFSAPSVRMNLPCKWFFIAESKTATSKADGLHLCYVLECK